MDGVDDGKTGKDHKDDKEELCALFSDDLPDTLTNDLLALAHLSDIEEEEQAGPVRRRRTVKRSDPYRKFSIEDEMKELDLRTRAWKPYKNKDNKK